MFDGATKVPFYFLQTIKYDLYDSYKYSTDKTISIQKF